MSGIHLQLVDVPMTHRESAECPCKPRLNIIEERDGQLAWAYMHYALPTAGGWQLAGHTYTTTFNAVSPSFIKLAYGDDPLEWRRT